MPWTALIVALFVWVGARFGIEAIVVGTSATDQVITEVGPFIFAAIIFGFVVALWRM